MTARTPRNTANGAATTAPRTPRTQGKGKGKVEPIDFAAMFEANEFQPDSFELDPDLLSDEFNEKRRLSLPYGTVVNNDPAGIVIEPSQLIQANWHPAIPPEDQLDIVFFPNNPEPAIGILLRYVRLVILDHTPIFFRWKSTVANKALAKQYVGLPEEVREQYSQEDMKDMEACCEYAVVLLDNFNRPLHDVPFIFRFRNVALWSFNGALQRFYGGIERMFAIKTGRPVSGKSNRWRSLAVVEAGFEAVVEGEGGRSSACCKTTYITMPDHQNFSRLFLGTVDQTPLIWSLHDQILGFNPNTTPALPPVTPVEVLPPASDEPELRRANTEDEDDAFFDDEEETSATTAQTVEYELDNDDAFGADGDDSDDEEWDE